MKTPQELNLPPKFKQWHYNQGELVQQIASSPESIYLLDAPPGTGKSLVGIASYLAGKMDTVSKDVLAKISDKPRREFETKCIFITRTKQLQDQVLSEFPMTKTLKGRSNYRCMLHPNEYPSITAADCTNSENKPCDYHGSGCPYVDAKRIALRAEIAVLNTSYFLTELNFGPAMFAGYDFVIIDEVDELENELMNRIQLKITGKQLKRLGIGLPKDPHTMQGWMVWADALNLWDKIGKIQFTLDDKPESEWTDIDINLFRVNKDLEAFQNKIITFMADVNDTWVFSEDKDKNEDPVWLFKPVKVAPYADSYIWRHGKRFLGMSGTILDPEQLCHDLGILKWAYFKSDSPFPLEQRPLYYHPEVNLTQKRMAEELPALANAVGEIIEKYPKDKILVHTTSYFIRNYLQDRLQSDRIISHDSSNREEMLNIFKGGKIPFVMLSPAFDRGVDLPDDLCRCIIICKVPYMSLGDKQVKSRMKTPGGEKWYLLQAARTIIQMSGRGVRNNFDYCDTFILDRQFGSLRARIGRYLPAWWTGAIKERKIFCHNDAPEDSGEIKERRNVG